ncbi:MAG: O-acetyl-ADP-ribose deacetylase [Bacteroidia bacterium]|nr:O-acetyl-ADP-ribose deacetylase [Bacteroidia bacterium]
MTRIEWTLGDITRISADAIVNAANTSLMGGSGVDGAIHRAGGPEILEACRQVVARQGGCATGMAVITPAGRLPARYVIHTVGPVWRAEADTHLRDLLAQCYHNSLHLGAAHGVRTITFPNISTGVYHFPKSVAASVATRAVQAYVAAHPDAYDRICFVCFEAENARLYQALLGTPATEQP